MQKLLYKLKNGPFGTVTFRQTATTFTATFINGTLGFFFYILTARFLGPSDFGILTVSLTVLALVADIGNFGINAGIVNFVSKNRLENPMLSKKYLKLALKLKLLIGLVTVVVGYFLAPVISIYLFKKPQLIEPLRLAFVGVATTWLFSFATSYFQAFEKFYAWGLIQILTNFLRMVLILLLFYQASLSVNSSLFSYLIMPLIGFILTMAIIPKDFLRTKGELKLAQDFIGFNKWIGISAIASSLSSKIDTFILAALLTTRDVGIYSAAYQIVQVVPQLISALGTVVAPKFASFQDDIVALKYLIKSQKMVAVIALMGLLGIPVFKLLIPTLMGEKYDDSFIIFSILLVGMLIFLFATPIHNYIIYYRNYPKILTSISIINLFIMISVGYFATLRLGIIGMAITTVVMNILNYAVPAVWVKNNKK